MIAISTCLVVVPAANETLPAFATKSLPAVAVPPAVANRTLTVFDAGCESRRVMAAFWVPASPSVIVTSSIEIDGGVIAIMNRGSRVSDDRQRPVFLRAAATRRWKPRRSCREEKRNQSRLKKSLTVLPFMGCLFRVLRLPPPLQSVRRGQER